MNWQEVCADPNLQDLPYKIELNQWGQIVMSPVKVYHSILQWEIQRRIYELLGRGKVVPECAVRTREGTKVADVAWISDALFEKVRDAAECTPAPEICVEIISASNTEAEMQLKRDLYFEAGAKEVWICDNNGIVEFYTVEGKSECSQLLPGFPRKIEV